MTPAPTPLDGDDAALRKPPHSVEAEQSLLGCFLLDASTFGAVSDTVAAGDLYNYAHRLIFSAIQSLLAEPATVDVISVFERLERDGKAMEAGGLGYLNSIAQSVPAVAGVHRYAEIIKERSTLRQTIATLDDLTTRAFRNDPADSILDDAKVALGKIAEGRKLGAGRLPLLKLDQLREIAHSVTWLVKHIIAAESLGLLFGASGTFKSFIALDLALHVAHGLPWLGRKTKRGPVVYIAGEGAAGLWPRIVAWHQARRLRYEDVPLYVVPAALNLGTDAWRVVEAAQSAGVTPVLVVVDTMSQTYRGEENSANEVAAYLGELSNRFKLLWRCAVMVIHHTGHTTTERPRGSSALQANTDYLYGVVRDEKELLATMACVHRKDGEPFGDVPFALAKRDIGKDEDGDAVTSLVARHLSNVEDVQEAMAAESKAGRGGHNQLLLSLLQNGQMESELRQVFYRECGVDSADGRKKAYQRARAFIVSNGLAEFPEGFTLLLKAGHK